METERIAFFIFAVASLVIELTLYYSFMKHRKVPLLNVRSATLISIFTFSTSIGIIILGFIDSEELIYSCYAYLMVIFLHETFTTWIYIVQAWRINFIYLMNKQKLKSIKRFIKNVNTEGTTSTSKERITSRFNEENESSVINSTAESHFWEGIFEEDDGANEEEIDTKFQKAERKFYQKRIQISGKYMFFAIFFHFFFMILLPAIVNIENKTRRRPDGICEYGQLFAPLAAFAFISHLVLFSYFLFKIWKIKDNFKIRNQLYMIFITSLMTCLVLNLRNFINKIMMWQWPFVFIIIIQYWIVLGYPLWLYRKQHNLSLDINKNSNSQTDNTVEKFTNILNDKKKSKYFFKFLQLDYSIENLLFYQAVTSFEKINPKKKSKKKKYCQQIIKNFIQVNARLEINLEHSIRNSTIELAEKGLTNSACFEEAKQKIFFLMFSGSYPNFLSSKQYYEMMIDIDQINIEIGGEKEIQLNPLKKPNEVGTESNNDTKKESGIDTNSKNVNTITENEDKAKNDTIKDHGQKEEDDQSNSSSDTESSDQNKSSSETSNSDSDSD
ncbi:regulator of g protein signaling [Anaeramoeba flamelloides]|uniref:Regulator of g protein signaling n=1 Tax=Anaeramoeba flamelloides TaxID=1746091 RepID=A0ABQ8YPP0_9EUKA|nr:regulator of g protein signaling [Anaeramoeba flamelloides]